MKIHLIAPVIFLVVQAIEAHSEVSVNVNIGTPPAVIVTSMPSAPMQPQVVIETQPSFIFSPSLGFYVSVGIPYDIVYLDQYYYLNRGGRWLVSSSCQGPWAVIQRRLPPRLRKYRYEQIRQYRDREYAHYMRDRDNYRGQWHRPEGEWREQRREERRDESRDEHRGESMGEHRRESREEHRESKGEHRGEHRGEHED